MAIIPCKVWPNVAINHRVDYKSLINLPYSWLHTETHYKNLAIFTFSFFSLVAMENFQNHFFFSRFLFSEKFRQYKKGCMLQHENVLKLFLLSYFKILPNLALNSYR
jgi:hypothetical protein